MIIVNDTRQLAVDLGTTWTAAATAHGVVDLGERGAAMPSVIAVGDGGFVVGAAAERLIATQPDCGAREVKRRFGDTTPIILAGKPYGPEVLTTEILRAVSAKAAVEPAATTVSLSHPANWGEYKLDLLRNVGTAAGFAAVELISEPAAAARHYASTGRLAVGDTVAVYDFGGGTFDAAIITLTADGARLLGTPSGIERLGGIDLDQVVFSHVLSSLGGALDALDRTDPDVRRALTRLRVACTAAKEQLSADLDATIEVVAPGLSTEVRVTRDELESALRPRLAETTAALDRAIASAGITAGDLAGVVLVGGSSRIPLVAEVVEGHTGRPVLNDGDVKLVVVQGALAGAPRDRAPLVAILPPPLVTPIIEATTPAPVTETVMSDQPTANTPNSAPTGTPTGKPAGGGRTPPPPPPKRGPSTAAKLAGGAAAAAAAVAGAVILNDDVADALGFGDDDSTTPPDVAAFAGEAARDDTDPGDDPGAGDGSGDGGDESMDAFDAADAPLATVLASTQVSQFAAPQPVDSGGFAAPQPSSASFDEPDRAPRQASPEPRPQPGTGVDSDSEFEAARALLLDRLDDFEAPPGTSPEDAAELKAELQGVIDRFEPAPGQSTEDALAMLRDQYDQHVQDFTQDQKIEALIEETQRDNEAEAETGDPVVDPPLGTDDPDSNDADAVDADPDVTVVADPGPASDPRVTLPTTVFDTVTATLNDDFDAIVQTSETVFEQAADVDFGTVVSVESQDGRPVIDVDVDPLGIPGDAIDAEVATFATQTFEIADQGVDGGLDFVGDVGAAVIDTSDAVFDAVPDAAPELDVPDVIVDTFDDAADTAGDAGNDALGFAEDIAGDVTPNSFDNLDFG